MSDQLLLGAIGVTLTLMVMVVAALMFVWRPTLFRRLCRSRKPKGWPLAKRLAKAILSSGKVPDEARPFVVSPPDCKNCQGDRRLPRWKVEEAHNYLRPDQLARALLVQAFCTYCLNELVKVANPGKAASAPAAKSDGEEKKPNVAKRVLAAFGLLQIPGVIIWAVGSAAAALVFLPEWHPLLAYFTAGVLLLFAVAMLGVCALLVRALIRG